MYFPNRIGWMMARLSAVVVFSVLLAIMLSGSAQSPFMAGVKQQNSSWTIMVYMADDFVSSLNWQEDFNEMEAAQQAPGTNIIALVDPYGPGNSTLYKIDHDPDFLNSTIVSARINDSGAVIVGGEVNMAAASTLSSFIEFSVSSYPATKNVLVLWGHGAGWRGLCPDGTDVLTLPELGDALSQATATIGKPLDLVVVDSCAEATLETLWEIREYSRLFVASEKDVPFQGLPYIIVMNDLAAMPNQSVEEFASKIADDYVSWSSTNTDYSVTMGVFNLSKVEPLVTALSALSAQGEKYDPIFHDTLRTTFNRSERYEEAYCMDFGHFMWQLQKADLPLEIRYYAIDSLLKGKAMVEHFGKYENPDPVNGVHVRNASGFTIFAPGNGTTDGSYVNLSLAMTNWFEFGRLLRADATTVLNGQGPIVVSTSNAANLTWQDGTDSCSVWVFRNQSSGLAYESALTVSGSTISFAHIPGKLTLATSSYRYGELHSYRTLNITLEGTAEIEILVSQDGQPVQDIAEEYEVLAKFLHGGNSLVILPSEGAGQCVASVRIPQDAGVGDVVTIEIVDKSSGKLVGTASAFVPRGTATVEVEILSTCGCPYRSVVPLLFALLPGLLILGFALSLHYQNGRRKEKDG